MNCIRQARASFKVRVSFIYGVFPSRQCCGSWMQPDRFSRREFEKVCPEDLRLLESLEARINPKVISFGRFTAQIGSPLDSYGRMQAKWNRINKRGFGAPFARFSRRVCHKVNKHHALSIQQCDEERATVFPRNTPYEYKRNLLRDY